MTIYEKPHITAIDSAQKYSYNVQIFRSLNGRDWFYTGQGRYCRSWQEVRQYLEASRLRWGEEVAN